VTHALAGAPVTRYWPFEDSATREAGEDERLAAFLAFS
jgi:hypothetical protein